MEYTLPLMKKVLQKYERQGRITSDLLNPILSQNPSLSDYFNKLRILRKELISLRQKGDKYDIADKKEEINELKLQYNTFMEEYLQEVLDRLHDKDYVLNLKTFELDGKDFCQVEPTLENLLLMSMLNRNLRSCYKVQPANRIAILKVLKDLLEEKHDLILLRLDIKSFFESIPFDKLLVKLEYDGILCPESYTLLNKIKSFCGNGKTNIGLPRGVPCSSFLSEIYMREIDSRIKNIPGVYFYQRYVDDIVVFIYPKSTTAAPNDYYDYIYKIVKAKGLVLHPTSEQNKIKLIDSRQRRNISFSYLGYHILKRNGKTTFLLSDDKYKHLEEWIHQAFRTFKYDLSNEKRQGCSLTRLLHQLRMMTSNYHLVGNKHHIMSGIFYKYPLLTSISQLQDLDEVLAEEIGKLTVNDIPLKMGDFGNRKFTPHETLDYITKRCSKYSFVQGYQDVKKSNIWMPNFKKYSKS